MIFIMEILIVCLSIEKKHWDKIDKAGLLCKGLLQGMNDYKD